MEGALGRGDCTQGGLVSVAATLLSAQGHYTRPRPPAGDETAHLPPLGPETCFTWNIRAWTMGRAPQNECLPLPQPATSQPHQTAALQGTSAEQTQSPAEHRDPGVVADQIRAPQILDPRL